MPRHASHAISSLVPLSFPWKNVGWNLDSERAMPDKPPAALVASDAPPRAKPTSAY
jgi:hypothetical protein